MRLDSYRTAVTASLMNFDFEAYRTIPLPNNIASVRRVVIT